VDGSDAFVVSSRMRRGPRAFAAILLIGMGFLSVGLFAAGLLPAYDWEKDGKLPDPATRCPERLATEDGYDGACVEHLIARGPIYLGKELLAGSFVLGVAALVGAFRFDRRFVTWSAALLVLLPYALIGSPLAFWDRRPGPIQISYILGLLAIVAVIAMAWSRRRRVVPVLSIVYVSAWIGLLAWNAERAHHFLGKGM
jgi:hypothetical protein